MSNDADPAPRHSEIDAFRAIAIAAVVLLHALPTTVENGIAIGLFPALAIPTRFAVPFFFITAGFFQRVDGVAPLTIIGRALRRLLPIYVIWILLYWLASRITPLPNMVWEPSWRKVLQGGPLFHLWFLPALGFGLAVVGVGRAKLGLRTTTAIAIVLAVIGLVLTSYHAPLFGQDVMEPRRNALFAPAFIVMGAWFVRSDTKLSAPRAAAIAIAGLAMIAVEEVSLRHVMAWQSLRSHDVSFGTFLFGAGAFLLARSWRPMAITHGLVGLGKVSLGVYITHLYFVRALTPAIGNSSLGQVIALAIASLILATFFSLALSRVPGVRRLVT